MTAVDVADNSLTGAQINSSTLGTVPNALTRRTPTAWRIARGRFSAALPERAVPAGDLCYESDPATRRGFRTALTTCAKAQLRLPDPGELALVFDHLGADQDDQWVASFFIDGAGSERSPDGKQRVAPGSAPLEINRDRVLPVSLRDLGLQLTTLWAATALEPPASGVAS